MCNDKGVPHSGEPRPLQSVLVSFSSLFWFLAKNLKSSIQDLSCRVSVFLKTHYLSIIFNDALREGKGGSICLSYCQIYLF